MASTLRRALPVSLLAASAFLLGAAFVALRLPPYPQAAALVHRLRSKAATPGPDEGGAGEDGWYEVVRRPGGATAEEALEHLDELGYLDSYGPGGQEVGVTIHVPARAQPGANLIVSSHETTVLLTDMEGEVLHQWPLDFEALPKPPGWKRFSPRAGKAIRRARLMEDGDLMVILERAVLWKVDKHARTIWADFGLYHHDLDVARDGTIYTLDSDVGVIPRIHAQRQSFEDFVTVLSPDGDVLRRFSLFEAFERSRYAPLLQRLPERVDVFHTNTLELLEGESIFGRDKLLTSIWGLDAIAVVDIETGVVDWALSGQWHRQHQPVLLEDGQLLLFDNMGGGDYSKVIQFDPFSQQVSWSFVGDEENDFYSALIGSCQRLENGNTLITESLSGRAFEVTPEGEVVWKWNSPYRSGPNGEGVAVLMEAIRLPPTDPGAWR
jgi:hypothetical protein